MEIKSRGINKHECFACSMADIKKSFSQDDDLFVLLNARRLLKEYA